jgi:hypothetical protein
MNLLKHNEVIEFIHLFLGREQRHSPCPRMERKNRGVSSDQKNHSSRFSAETCTSEYSYEQQLRSSEASDEQHRGSEASDEQHRGSEAIGIGCSPSLEDQAREGQNMVINVPTS